MELIIRSEEIRTELFLLVITKGEYVNNNLSIKVKNTIGKSVNGKLLDLGSSYDSSILSFPTIIIDIIIGRNYMSKCIKNSNAKSINTDNFKYLAGNIGDWIIKVPDIDTQHVSLYDVQGKFVPNIRHVVEGMKGKEHLVTVVFEDGSHVTKKCLPEDKYDLNVGVALCIADKVYGTVTQFHKDVIRRKVVKKQVKKKKKPFKND